MIGGGVRSPEDALIIAERAMELGFSSTAGVMHDGWGTLKPLSEKERSIYSRLRGMTKKSYARVNYFQDSLVAGEPSNWRCRAGARYLYICENGLVHYCSQQRGYPATPLEDYGEAELRQGFNTQKACAPLCTVGCVQQVAMLDNWRRPQRLSELDVTGRRRLDVIQPARKQAACAAGAASRPQAAAPQAVSLQPSAFSLRHPSHSVDR